MDTCVITFERQLITISGHCQELSRNQHFSRASTFYFASLTGYVKTTLSITFSFIDNESSVALYFK